MQWPQQPFSLVTFPHDEDIWLSDQQYGVICVSHDLGGGAAGDPCPGGCPVK